MIHRTRTQRALLLIGSMGPLGHLPASGTVTVALVGVPLYYLTWAWSPVVYVVVTLTLIGVSIWIHDAGDRVLGTKDSRKLVWDEVVGFMVAVAFLPAFTVQLAAVAFVLERFIDIVKIPPANWIESRWPGGWGVVGDDIVAGLYTLGLVHLIARLAPAAMGLNP